MSIVVCNCYFHNNEERSKRWQTACIHMDMYMDMLLTERQYMRGRNKATQMYTSKPEQ